LGAGEDRVVDLRRQIFRQLGGQRLELTALLRDHRGGAVELALVVIAEAHQPARVPEQLLNSSAAAENAPVRRRR